MGKFNYYEKIAPIYEQTRWLTPSIAQEVADVILKLVEATPQTSFLEPGIGTGLNVLPLVKRNYSVTGIDVSPAMLRQFQQKFSEIPPNLTLIQGDASKLPFAENIFDVVLTVHMIHTVSNWQMFLDEIRRVLKKPGFYLNAQWITPPARREFESYLKAILSKYEPAKSSTQIDQKLKQINVEEYFHSKGYKSKYVIAKKWSVSNTIAELLSFYRSRAYGLCWHVSEEIFNLAMDEFEQFCRQNYGSLQTELSSEAKFEICTYTQR